jgi:hypothetical protein
LPAGFFVLVGELPKNRSSAQQRDFAAKNEPRPAADSEAVSQILSGNEIETTSLSGRSAREVFDYFEFAGQPGGPEGKGHSEL